MLRLERSGLQLEVAPEIGGSIVSFRAHGADVLRPTSPHMLAAKNPLQLACFPMTPFANRIADGRFEISGQRIELPVRAGGPRHPLHGYGWKAPWRVDRTTNDVIALSWDSDDTPWPWRSTSTQRFWLEDAALVVALSIMNRAETPMPASLGLHPYFPAMDDASLEAQCDGMWETDSDLMPTRWIETTPFMPALPLRGTDLDNCFTGLHWPVRISWKTRPFEAALSGTACRFMQVFTRGSDGSFCVEAQTAMPDAMNREDGVVPAGTGLVVLAPGETLECVTRFEVIPTASARS